MRAVGEAFEEERLQPSRKEKGACFLKKHEACYLGFGAVFAAYLVAIWHAGEPARMVGASTGMFFAGCSFGMAIVGAGSVVLGGISRQRSRMRLSTGAVMIVMALACSIGGLMSLINGSDVVSSDLTKGVSGMAFGAGIFVLALVWTDVYSSLAFVDAFRKGSCSVLLGVVLAAVGQWVAEGLPIMLYAAALTVVAAAAAMLAFQEVCGTEQMSGWGQTGEIERLDSGKQSESLGWGHRLTTLLKPSWAPLCGLGVCAFLLGLLWAQEIPLQTSAGWFFWNKVSFVGPLLVAGGMALVSRRVCGYAAVKRFFWVAMPVVAALFVITPLFDNIDSVGWNVLVVNLQNGGSTVLVVCTWSLLLASSRASGLSANMAFGGCLAFVSGMSLAGFAIYREAGMAANVAAVVMFVAYLCATVVFLAVDGSEEPMARRQESNIVESYIEARCKTVAESHALTPREAEMLVLLSRGHSYGFIAESVYISEATVRTHARNIYRKIGISSQEDLLNYIDAL